MEEHRKSLQTDAEIIRLTADHVKGLLLGETTGHDWWHTYRVWKTATNIGKQENANTFLVQLAALLHDVADWKFHEGNEEVNRTEVSTWLRCLNVDNAIIERVCLIINEVSFKGEKLNVRPGTIEGQVVQDADRLDAIGAIGIARVFAFGGSRQREIYNPDIKYQQFQTKEDYLNSKSTSINHFYEKLLLLKNLMNTETGKRMAEKRHQFLETYLNQFFNEWEGNF